MVSRSLSALLVSALAALHADAAPLLPEVWRSQSAVSGADAASGVAIDANGDVFAVGTSSERIVVEKRHGGDGSTAWRKELEGEVPGASASALALDSSGAVIVVGRVTNADTGGDGFVAKLAGSDGAEQWRVSIHSPCTPEPCSVSIDGLLAVAVGAGDEVIAAGTFENDQVESAMLATKLAAADGAQRWRTEIAFGQANAVAIDGQGNAVVAGEIGLVSKDFLVAKLASDTGSVLWQREIDTSCYFSGSCTINDDRAYTVAVDSADDVVAGGFLGGYIQPASFAVVKLSGASGQTRWTKVRVGLEGASGVARAVAIDAADDVLASGNTGGELRVAKFAGNDGSPRWDRLIGPGRSYAVAAGAAGEVVAGGAADDAFFVATLDSGDGAVLGERRIAAETPEGFARAAALAAGDPDRVVAAGWIDSEDTARDALVVELPEPSAALLGSAALLALARRWNHADADPRGPRSS